MASGLPIVCLKENIITKSDNKEFASLIKLSPLDIKEKVSKLLDDSSLRKSMSIAARKVAIDEFSWTNNATLFLSYTNQEKRKNSYYGKSRKEFSGILPK